MWIRAKADVVLISAFGAMLASAGTHLGLFDIDKVLLAALTSSATLALAMSYWELVSEMEREKRRFAAITKSLYSVLDNHERRLPPPTE